MFQFSRWLAIVYGIALPVLETIRRAKQLGDWSALSTWVDDYLIGAFLLAGAWLTSRGRHHNARYLAAAWGFACGIAYGSFFGQLHRLDQPDPSGVPVHWVVTIKGVGFALAIAALVGALKAPADSNPDDLLHHPERLDEMLDATDDA